MIICDSSTPGMSGGIYTLDYIEAIEGKRHGYMTPHKGVCWTRNPNHPADPRCPECSGGDV